MVVPMAQAVTVLCLSLRELAEKEERRGEEVPQCCHGIPHTGLAIPLAQP